MLARPRKSFPHVCTHVALRIFAWSPIGKAGSLSPKRTPAGSSPSGLQISSRAASSPCGDDAVYGPKGRRPARCSHVSLAHLSLPKVPFQGQRERFGVVNAPSLLHSFGRGPLFVNTQVRLSRTVPTGTESLYVINLTTSAYLLGLCQNYVGILVFYLRYHFFSDPHGSFTHMTIEPGVPEQKNVMSDPQSTVTCKMAKRPHPKECNLECLIGTGLVPKWSLGRGTTVLDFWVTMETSSRTRACCGSKHWRASGKGIDLECSAFLFTHCDNMLAALCAKLNA